MLEFFFVSILVIIVTLLGNLNFIIILTVAYIIICALRYPNDKKKIKERKDANDT